MCSHGSLISVNEVIHSSFLSIIYENLKLRHIFLSMRDSVIFFARQSRKMRDTWQVCILDQEFVYIYL